MSTKKSQIRSRHVTEARAMAQRAKLEGSQQGQDRSPQTSTMTIDLAVQQYLHSLTGGNRSLKTLEWHQTALGFFQQFLMSECHLLRVGQITATEVREWFVSLRQTPASNGKVRTARTIETSARSARAFCNWLVFCEYLDQSPLTKVTFPKAGKPLLRIIEPEEFERLLLACRPSTEIGALVDRAAARNRAILWVLLDTGIRVSEWCGLRLQDFDRWNGILTVFGKGSKERRVALGRTGLRNLLCYLDHHRPDKEELSAWGRPPVSLGNAPASHEKWGRPVVSPTEGASQHYRQAGEFTHSSPYLAARLWTGVNCMIPLILSDAELSE